MRKAKRETIRNKLTKWRQQFVIKASHMTRVATISSLL